MLIYNTPPTITAFSTEREGGDSVDGNKSFPSDSMLFLPHHQVHGTKTQIIDEDFLSLNALEQTILMDGVDALCTNLTNVCVCVKTADCIPVLLWDEENNVVSAVHAGWKGTRKRIVEANIDFLCEKYGINPANLKAVIGPGIGPESFEIGDEVYAEFEQYGFDMKAIAKRYPNSKPTPTQPEKWHIDLWECNKLQLISKGVKEENIFVSGIDTFLNFNRFHSARKNCPGRIINGIMLKKSNK